jgi:hypothetical protein
MYLDRLFQLADDFLLLCKQQHQFDLPKITGEACLLKPQARQVFIKALEEKLNSSIQHPVTGIQLDYRRCYRRPSALRTGSRRVSGTLSITFKICHSVTNVI